MGTSRSEPGSGVRGVKPVVAAVDMGYGHLRAARPIARALGVPVTLADRPPIVDAAEAKVWNRVRTAYEWTSRASQVPVAGRPFRWALDAMTDIPPLHPRRDLSAPTRGVTALERLVRRGLGRGLVERLRETGAPLVATFYSPAIAADAAGLGNVWLLVTDSDVNRVWAPRDAARGALRYLAPSPRVVRRLRSYGVPEERIAFTGFPLPRELVGGPELPVLRRNLAARLVRLDPRQTFRRDQREEIAHFLGALPEGEEGRPPTVTFAVGGAGAQAAMAGLVLPGMRAAIEEGRVRLVLVAGVRREVEARFREEVERAGMRDALGRGLEILAAETLDDYFDRFDALLATTDVLWTKPSELSFYAALGLPLVFSPPVGVHERYNRRWVRESGAGLVQRDPAASGQWLSDWLEDGALAAAAWSGFTRLPKHGLERILAEVAPAAEVEVEG
jgi:hypothetical protein